MSASRNCISNYAAANTRSIRATIWRRCRPRRPKRRMRAEPAAPGRGGGLGKRFAEAAGEILDELPGDAARARAAGDRPFVGLGFEPIPRKCKPVALGIAAHDRVI